MTDNHDDELEAALIEHKKHPEQYYLQSYAGARGGDHRDALELLHGFVAAVNARKPVPAPILDYLCLAFSEYLADPSKSIESALLLTRPKRRPRGSPRDPVPMVADLYLARKRDGLGKTAAKARVCAKWNIDQRTLEKYDGEYSLIRDWDVPTLETMARPTARQLPTR